MNTFKTIRSLTVLAIAIMLTAGTPALAQTGPSVDGRKEALQQQLTETTAAIKALSEQYNATSDTLDMLTAGVRRVERQVQAGRSHRDAYRELLQIAQRADRVETQFEGIARKVPQLHTTLDSIIAEAKRYEFNDIYRAGHQSLAALEGLNKEVKYSIEQTRTVKDELKRLISSLNLK